MNRKPTPTKKHKGRVFEYANRTVADYYVYTSGKSSILVDRWGHITHDFSIDEGRENEAL